MHKVNRHIVTGSSISAGVATECETHPSMVEDGLLCAPECLVL